MSSKNKSIFTKFGEFAPVSIYIQCIDARAEGGREGQSNPPALSKKKQRKTERFQAKN